MLNFLSCMPYDSTTRNQCCAWTSPFFFLRRRWASCECVYTIFLSNHKTLDIFLWVFLSFLPLICCCYLISERFSSPSPYYIPVWWDAMAERLAEWVRSHQIAECRRLWARCGGSFRTDWMVNTRRTCALVFVCGPMCACVRVWMK